MSSTGTSPPAKGEDCLSCKLISGGGLLAASGYIYYHARKSLRGGSPSLGTVTQIMFAMGMASWGIIILANPVGKLPSNK